MAQCLTTTHFEFSSAPGFVWTYRWLKHSSKLLTRLVNTYSLINYSYFDHHMYLFPVSFHRYTNSCFRQAVRLLINLVFMQFIMLFCASKLLFSIPIYASPTLDIILMVTGLSPLGGLKRLSVLTGRIYQHKRTEPATKIFVMYRLLLLGRLIWANLHSVTIM
jgi:hypothetical protein